MTDEFRSEHDSRCASLADIEIAIRARFRSEHDSRCASLYRAQYSKTKSSGQSTIPDVLASTSLKRFIVLSSGQSTIPDVLAFSPSLCAHRAVPVRARFPMC